MQGMTDDNQFLLCHGAKRNTGRMLLRACQAFVERIQELEEQLDAIKEQS